MSAPAAFSGTADVIHHIAGKPVRGTGNRALEVYNPATGTVTRQVRLASDADVNAAVAAARAAFPAWAETPPIRRARVLQQFLTLLLQHKDRLAAMMNNLRTTWDTHPFHISDPAPRTMCTFLGTLNPSEQPSGAGITR
jgi:hypothetical protein